MRAGHPFKLVFLSVEETSLPREKTGHEHFTVVQCEESTELYSQTFPHALHLRSSARILLRNSRVPSQKDQTIDFHIAGSPCQRLKFDSASREMAQTSGLVWSNPAAASFSGIRSCVCAPIPSQISPSSPRVRARIAWLRVEG